MEHRVDPGSQQPSGPTGIARVVDSALEATIAASFTRIGPVLRRRLGKWETPSPTPGRVVVITGATSGLGREAARELATLGCTVVAIGRDAQRLEEVGGEIADAGGVAILERADLADLDDTRALAERLAGHVDRIDVLIHNAGALLNEYQSGRQGHEVTVTVHVLSPYLLTELLRPLLDAADRAKVITMTSGGMYSEAFDLRTLEMSAERYRGSVAYARAKRAQVVLTAAWQRRQPDATIDFHLVHPGWAATPGVASSLPRFDSILGPLLRTPKEGVDTLVWLATSDPGSPHGGHLWLDRRERSFFRLPKTKVDKPTLEAQGDALISWLTEVTAPST